MKKRDIWFFVFFFVTASLIIFLSYFVLNLRIESFGGTLIMTCTILAVGFLTKKWFNQQWKTWEEEDLEDKME